MLDTTYTDINIIYYCLCNQQSGATSIFAEVIGPISLLFFCILQADLEKKRLENTASFITLISTHFTHPPLCHL